MLFLQFVVLTSYHHILTVFCCNEVERDSLLSFITPTPPNWSPSTNCCHWQGVACTAHGGAARVSHLRLPESQLSGTINASSLAKLPFLVHINLSHNHFSGPLHQSLPLSLKELDLSSNHFNGSVNPPFYQQAFNLITFNISNNSFVGPLPSSICKTSPFLEILDFSMNSFSGYLELGLVHCQNLQILRAGENSLSYSLPDDLFTIATLKEISLSKNEFSGTINTAFVKLSNLEILELNDNKFIGELPSHIGLLSKLERLQLHDNAFNGSLPSSLMDCSNLTVLILRSNKFEGEISALNFAKLHRLQVLDLGINRFFGKIPNSLCSCTKLISLRLGSNQLVGEIPPCMASLTSITFLSLSHNKLSNIVGAIKILKHCHNLIVLFMTNCFNETMKIDDEGLVQSTAFQNLEYLSLGVSKIEGQIPPWIARLTKLKILDLSFNNISGPFPTWLVSMPHLFLIDISENSVSGSLPREIGEMKGLIADHDISEFNNLALPFFINNHEYNSMYHVPRALRLRSNNLSGEIPQQIGKLKSLQELDLSDNNFSGGIPDQLSLLTNLETMNVSMNNLTGEIPNSLTQLHFMASFSVAYNDLEGEVPRGGQFDTFPAESFEGNPRLNTNHTDANVSNEADDDEEEEEEEEEDYYDWISWYNLPLGLGYFVGFAPFSIVSLFRSWRR